MPSIYCILFEVHTCFGHNKSCENIPLGSMDRLEDLTYEIVNKRF